MEDLAQSAHCLALHRLLARCVVELSALGVVLFHTACGRKSLFRQVVATNPRLALPHLYVGMRIFRLAAVHL